MVPPAQWLRGTRDSTQGVQGVSVFINCLSATQIATRCVYSTRGWTSALQQISERAVVVSDEVHTGLYPDR